MKLAFYETQDWEERYLAKTLAGLDLAFYEEPFSESRKPDSAAEVLSIFKDSQVTGQVLRGLPNLKFIATRTTGYDHIDMAACRARGIKVANVPAYGENTVAEFTFALLLALSRKIYPSLKRVKEQGKFSCEGLQGVDLAGKTIGVVGAGHIGSYVVKIAHGFGMSVVAFDPHPKENLIKEFGVKFLGLEELLAASDVITLHVPYGSATHHLINLENIFLIKPGALLINTARGGLVETAALVKALRQGILAGAALDVLEEEGFIEDELNLLYSKHPNAEQLRTALADHELMDMDNVIITPHNAFNTQEAVQRILDATAQNIKSFLENQPQNLVEGK